MAYQDSRKDRYLLHNTLLCLIRTLQGKNLTVDLRNDTYVCGTLSLVDGHMNITLDNVIYCDPQGNEYKFEQLFVQSRNIRYVHIPESVPIISTLKQTFNRSKPQKNKDDKQLHITRKRKKALKQHLQIVADL